MALNNVPNSGQTLSDSRVPINANFATIGAAFVIDHVDYNVAGQGKHNKVTFPVQAVAPVFAAGEVGLYNLLYAVSGVDELFVKNQAGQATPMTAVSKTTPGWAWLPCGLLVKWGVGVANGFTTITLPVGVNIPAFTQILTMQVCTAYANAADGDGFVRLNNFVAPWTQFTVYGSARTTVTNKAVAFNYLAIGI